MSEFKKYNIRQFEKYISALSVSRRISLIQLHHTYSPSYKQFTGNNHIALQTGMRSYHIKYNGWSDIGQHFSIFPDGMIVTGRSVEMIPAGIKGANTGAICIECVGNFDAGGDIMSDAQKESIVSVVKILLDKFSLQPENAVIYHSWWNASGKKLGDYIKGKSAKTCPGTNFFGGSSRNAFETNLLPLISTGEKDSSVKQEIKNIAEILSAAGIITDMELWQKKCADDTNVYWLCRKTADYVKTK